MVIDAGQRLGRGIVGQREPPNDVHLPQLHRHRAFPAFPFARAPVAQTGVDQLRAHQRSTDSERSGATLRLDNSNTNRLGAQYGRECRSSNSVASTLAGI
jgi:hypothetical protein